MIDETGKIVVKPKPPSFEEALALIKSDTEKMTNLELRNKIEIFLEHNHAPVRVKVALGELHRRVDYLI